MKNLWKLFIQITIYFFVGLGATLVEWGVFYLLNEVWHIHYAAAVTVAYIFSPFANWVLGRLLLFKQGSAKGLLHEVLSIYAVSVIGLLLNLLIMWVLIDKMSVNTMLSKVIATGIVFFGNFAVRKFFIYKKNS